MFLPGTTNSMFIFSSLVILMIMVSITLGEAKRGCAAFGHSCFGGHGKRSDLTPVDPNLGDILHIFKLPSSNGIGEVSAATNDPREPYEISPEDQEQDDGDSVLILPSQYSVRFSPLFRKWLMNSYRGLNDMLEVEK